MAKQEERREREELAERWSAQANMEVVLRLLKGEDLGELSREVQVPAPELEAWRRIFMEGEIEGLKRRRGGPTGTGAGTDPEGLDLGGARRRERLYRRPGPNGERERKPVLVAQDRERVGAGRALLPGG